MTVPPGGILTAMVSTVRERISLGPIEVSSGDAGLGRRISGGVDRRKGGGQTNRTEWT